MSEWRAFKGILHRDLLVFWRNIRGNSVRIFVQPTFFLVVFGFIMPRLGLFERGYAEILIPGVVTIAAMSSSAFGSGALIGLSFFRNKEIRAHIISPISIPVLVAEKVVYGVFQALVSSLSMLFMGWLLFRGSVSLSFPNPILLLLLIILTGIAFSGIGIAVGSRFRRPPIMFEVLQLLILPMIFFGGTFFPLNAIKEVSPFFYVALHVLPNVYTNEAMRALLTPQISHIPLAHSFLGLGVASTILVAIALREFRKRAIS